jgi:predicted type IV restriction endonuclease
VRGMGGRTEAFARGLIDGALRESGWDLGDRQRVRFELTGAAGRADYVLSGDRAPLGVLEAKREAIDPYEARAPARGYAISQPKVLSMRVSLPPLPLPQRFAS